MASQIGQDAWILAQAKSGYFVDIGAYDGVTDSNTLRLEQGGWDGICVEPLPEAFEALKRNRESQCFNVAAYNRSGEQVVFRQNAMRSGIVQHVDEKERATPATITNIPTISLNDLLEQANAPRNITYISIDTEGSEIEILEGFDFDRWNVSYWTVEHNDHLYGNSERSEALKRLFVAHGYDWRIVEQDIWFSRERPISKPTTPQEIHERRQADLRRFTRHIRERIPLRVVKFNDGEWHAMTGRRGTNCDNHWYSPELRKELLSAYRELREAACISDYIVNFPTYPEHTALAKKIGYPSDWFINFGLLHDLPLAGQHDCRTPELKDFYRAIREDDRPKVFVGPERLRPEPFLRTTHRVTVPMLSAFKSIASISASTTAIASQLSEDADPVFLLCCGFTSCILARNILRVSPQATVIDLGSALDPLIFGKTRKSQMSTQELREFYADFECRWEPMPHYYESIPGWFNYADIYSEMVERFDGGRFVEVGTWLGRSAAFLAVEILNSGKPITLDCVDHFQGSKAERNKSHKSAKTLNIKGMCANNLRPFWSTEGNEDYTARKDNMLRIIPRPSAQAAKLFADRSIDFCFIDAGHTEAEVEQDIRHWLPKIKPGGVLAGHDYCKPWPGVIRAVDRLLPQRKLVSSNSWLVEV